MNSEHVFIALIIVVVANFLTGRFLSWVNLKNIQPQLPPEAHGIYSEEKYSKSQNYLKTKGKFAMFTSAFSVILVLLMLFFDGFAFVDQLAYGISQHYILHSLLFFAIIGFLFDLISKPFEVYSVFVIEEKFGFNKTTAKTFITDSLKSWLLTAILGGGLLSLILWIYHSTGQWFVLIALFVMGGFGIFMSMFYTSIIVPLFNKLKPLEEGELKDAIEQFGQKAGFPMSGISVIDSSKRSSKSNAYFSGLGRKKRIVLFDTLIENHTVNELVAVLAHEIGHYKKRHIQIGLITGLIQTGGLLLLLYLFLGYPVFQQAIGAAQPSFHLGLVVFGLLYSPFSMLLGLLDNFISRKNEYAADRFAADYNMKDHLSSALKKLSADNLSNLTPHPLYVFFYYSHPPLLKRLKALEDA
jgi:STE24 endopeptidase